MATASELREMSVEELGHQLNSTRQELFRLRFQASTEKLEAPSNLKKLRRDVARILTIRHERERSEAVAAA
ncbi:50S ribosomal protein L29 [Alienimonas chondri]|uniref:Large ribosomal subunit protein uL29 n=1 Tax=Alienimonas chondri TaxID=2681879 RepID=A0ABX1V7J3_9PLAN|nr:50S ribosomal protein L29 [Alienimonas chondri]NNJ24177.1 50S ribosomal protein L29 [Alienimonas chondri]